MANRTHIFEECAAMRTVVINCVGPMIKHLKHNPKSIHQPTRSVLYCQIVSLSREYNHKRPQIHAKSPTLFFASTSVFSGERGRSVRRGDGDVTSSYLPPTELLTDEKNLEATHQQLTLFIEEYVERSGTSGVVVGMSGGVDSTLAAALAVDALGPDRVFGLLLPCNKTAEVGSHDALTVAEALGIDYEEIHLQPLIRCFERLLVGDEGRDERIRALGNTTARLRMACLYYAANTQSKLVLGTGNRSERLLGYFTKYGDGGCDLLPLANLYKTEVRALARHMGLPCRIVEKPSTAGLWAEQTDEGELGATYDCIDAVLHYVVDRRYRAETVAEELDIPIETVWEVLNKHLETHHKRRLPATPGRESVE